MDSLSFSPDVAVVVKNLFAQKISENVSLKIEVWCCTTCGKCRKDGS